LLLALTGINAREQLADTVTAGVFVVTAVLSMALNVRDFIISRRKA